MDHATVTCGQRLDNGDVCQETATVELSNVYRHDERGPYLTAIHRNIRCPRCGVRQVVKRLLHPQNLN